MWGKRKNVPRHSARAWNFNNHTGTGKKLLQLLLQPLKSIHLHSDLYGEIEPNGDIYYVYLFGLIGVIIMLLASINFI